MRVDANGFPQLTQNDGGVALNGAPSSLFRELDREVRRFIEQGSTDSSAPRAAASSNIAPAATPISSEQQAWLDQIAPMADAAAARLGVAPEVLTAQAALETGFGRSPIRNADGADSHNLFAIKAGSSWKGESTRADTTEIENGQAVARRESFRSYGGVAQSFDDLGSLLLNNPRYRAAVNQGGDALAYGRALQQGGYATDPAYADKLASVAARIRSSRK